MAQRSYRRSGYCHPHLEQLEERRVLDGLVFDRAGVKVQAFGDFLPNAAAVPILVDGSPVTTADQIAFSVDVNPTAIVDARQWFVLNTNGDARLLYPDGQSAPGTQDNFGTTVTLSPLLITQGPQFFLSQKLEQINLLTDAFASQHVLRLQITGRPANGPSASNPGTAPVSVQWDVTVLPPGDKTAEVLVGVTASFTAPVTLSATHLANAEAFREGVLRSHNVPRLGTHDADELTVNSLACNNLATENLNSAVRNQLLFAGGKPFDGLMELNQLAPAPPNGDAPNIHVRILPAADRPEYRAQAFITDNAATNGASDNVAAWAGRILPSPVIPAGSRFAWTEKIVASDSPTDNEAFVCQEFQDLLHRQVDPSGLASWSAALDEGMSRSQLALGIEGSREYREGVVQDIYVRVLGRAPDPSGLNNWVASLGSGSTAEQVESLIRGSDEYFRVRGQGTNDGFLGAIYTDVLGRAIDPSGMRTWSDALAGGASRNAVALAILASLESDRIEVANLYRQLLHREPDPSGLDSSTTALQAGLANETLIAFLTGSDEYFLRL
jgi:Domain of unknown function (DUF4214)